ncbi:histidine decarboxylase isoform X2 [Pseudonaja textilis]|uniref:histidine decarboxylase isoform X2 n=1 Tax=Pseudonaja textilis TaxID=8673 RepID=UPI000EA94035|nr:histidine decarboxylase isoform X2 [Pseudonaja textilis]
MDQEEYRWRGKEMVDYICQYLTNIRERRVYPDVQPGYMRDQLPDGAPLEPESWDSIFRDIENIIMPGVVHWQSPQMHAYFPALTSWPSLLGDMLANAINCLGFTWASSPACTELEMNVMDWLAQMMGLPETFLHYHPGSKGGGILQSTVSESTLIALLAARKNKILEMKTSEPNADDSILNSRFIAYASDQAHSSVEKAGLISLVKMRFLPVDENFALRGETLSRAMEEDRSRGLVPIFVCATLGTTGVCAFDCLSELGPICAKEGLWLHIDAAYAGTAFLCPEYRFFLKGIEYADSFAFNPSKWMMVHFDCTAFWVKDKYKLQQTFSVNPVYLRHPNSGSVTDFMGTEMAKYFESLLRSNPLFEIPAKRHLGLVVFRLKGPNWMTEKLLKDLNKSGKLFVIPATIQEKLIIRFTVTSQFTTREDIQQDWALIQQTAVNISNQSLLIPEEKAQIPNQLTNSSSKAAGIAPPIFTEKEKGKVVPFSRITMQPRRGSLNSSLSLLNAYIPKAKEPHLDEGFTENSRHLTNCDLPSVLSFSTQNKTKTVRSFSLDSPLENIPCASRKFLSKLPKEILMIKKEDLKKQSQFYHMPSFPECTIQCGLQLPCCPLQTII